MTSEAGSHDSHPTTGARPQRQMPLAITLVYAVIGVCWIFFSDLAVERLFPTFEESSRLQTYKGWFYIALSAAILYWLLHRYQRRNDENLTAVSRMTAALAASENEIRQINVALERRVEERTRQLAAANHELEAFVYAVSHDLRAPLRSMAGFSQALQDVPGSGLDDRATHYLRRIQEASQRMSALIDDLLNLSRINQSEMAMVDVDFSRLAADAAQTVRERYPGREVALSIAAGMRVHGDARLLRIALENLLDNAFKYTGRTPHATVAVGTEVDGTERHYFVRDNGVGFNMAFAGKLFGPFQRMHTESQFPGTGIGLVTVQRILARHGGRIWAKAEVDHGATFTFTLPGPVTDAGAARN